MPVEHLSGPGEMHLGLRAPPPISRLSSIRCSSAHGRGGISDLMVISGNPTQSYSLRTGTFIVSEDLKVALTGITAGRLLDRYYTRAEQQEFVKRLQLDTSCEL